MANSQSNSNLDLEPQFSLPQCNQTSPLLSLPLELRSMIFDLILPYPKGTKLLPNVHSLFQIAERGERGRKVYKQHEKVLGLARTCQQLNSAFLPFYFTSYTFSFPDAYNLYRYLYMIGPHRRRLIRSIEFYLRSGFLYSTMVMSNREVFLLATEVLADCTSLERLNIGVSWETIAGMQKGQDTLLAMRDMGYLDALKGMGLPRLDLRMRESTNWSSEAAHTFEQDWHPSWFKKADIKEFEEILRKDMMSSKIAEDIGKLADKLNSQVTTTKEITYPENFDSVGRRRSTRIRKKNVKGTS
ncbi:hypothetical protein BGZ60DRAFT_148497 [Tricladium varicosporioides]|nr:hypothetical protein BGZ60DRAFT_148497 [Hymenoscyphus varicosporioides]